MILHIIILGSRPDISKNLIGYRLYIYIYTLYRLKSSDSSIGRAKLWSSFCCKFESYFEQKLVLIYILYNIYRIDMLELVDRFCLGQNGN